MGHVGWGRSCMVGWVMHGGVCHAGMGGSSRGWMNHLGWGGLCRVGCVS